MVHGTHRNRRRTLDRNLDGSYPTASNASQNRSAKRSARCSPPRSRDPGVGLVTVTRVKVTADLSLARIYWTMIGDPAERKKTAKALDARRRATSATC